MYEKKSSRKKYHNIVWVAAIYLFIKIAMVAWASESAEDVLKGDVSEGDISGGDAVAEEQSGENAEDIISVLLPTTFDITVAYDPDRGIGYIKSEDILMKNESEFPVKVNIVSMYYQVNREEDDGKEVQLSASLKQNAKPDTVIELSEEKSVEPISILLEAKQQDSISQADCAVMSFEGTIGEGNWKDNDLKIQIVYELEGAKENATLQD